MTKPRFDWEKHRLPDGSIDLYKAYCDIWENLPSPAAIRFGAEISELQSIKSRQLAALILVLMKDKSK